MSDFIDGNLNQVIEKSFRIAVHYLRTVHRKVYKILNRNEETVEDLAIDAIANLFVKDSSNQLPVKKAFTNWHPEIKTEEEFLFFLNRIVGRRVDQHISKLLKESDPLFNTILNSINYLIKVSAFNKTRFLGTVYIVESEKGEISGRVITQQAFDLIPASDFSDDKNLLQNIFQYIKTKTDYYPAIPFNSLILRCKELRSSDFEYKEKTESYSKTFELNEFIEQVLSEVKVKLNNSYIKSGKLSVTEADKIFDALKDMSEDLKDGGVNSGLYEYLKPHFVDLSVEEYKQKYHNILEYLFKVMRNTIKQDFRQ